MESESLTKYINTELKYKLKFKEKYYIDIDGGAIMHSLAVLDDENNKLTIKTLFPLEEGNLFDIVLKGEVKGGEFCQNLLNIIKSSDQHVQSLDVAVNVNDKRFTITKVRDVSLKNRLVVLPNELQEYIFSLVDLYFCEQLTANKGNSSTHNLAVTCKKILSDHNRSCVLVK